MMLIVRGTKKLRDRVKTTPDVSDVVSTTQLGDWFATAMFWRPQVVLLVNSRTFLPVFIELAPSATLLDRIPDAIDAALRMHGVNESFLATEISAMEEVRIAPTNDRTVVGVMSEFIKLGQHFRDRYPNDLVGLALRLAHTPVGPLRAGARFPDRALAEATGGTTVTARAPVRPTPAGSTRSTASKSLGDVYQLHITLCDTTPPIWRRILVDGTDTLEQLHEAIQAAFGWWNSHLHEFEIEGRSYGPPNPEWDEWGLSVVDERTVRLDTVAGAGTRMDYRYDFGDNWRHEIVVEQVVAATAETVVPACIEGSRAGPPEDCGGTGGFAELLEILADPGHPEHSQWREWLGSSFDPDAFDRRDFERNLATLRFAGFDT